MASYSSERERESISPRFAKWESSFCISFTSVILALRSMGFPPFIYFLSPWQFPLRYSAHSRCGQDQLRGMFTALVGHEGPAEHPGYLLDPLVPGQQGHVGSGPAVLYRL